jgi:hypothetical protein
MSVSHAPNCGSLRPKFSLRSTMLVCTLACVLLGGVAYLRSPSDEEQRLNDSQQQFLRFLDAVFAETPGFTTSMVHRTGYREFPEAWSYPGCQYYGHERLTMESRGGMRLKVGVSKFAITGAKLQENQKFARPIFPVHDPFIAMSEIWNGKVYTSAVVDTVLQVKAGKPSVPVAYAKWEDADGSYINHYTAWSANDAWIDPFDRTSEELPRFRIPDVATRALRDGSEMLRIDIRVTTANRDDDVPVEVIEDVVKLFANKMPY